MKKHFLVVLVAAIVLAVSVAGCTGEVKNATSPSPVMSTLTPPPIPSGLSSSASNLTVTASDIGQGDSLLINFPHNESLLVDGGQPYKGPTVVSYLHSVGISHLNGVIATHPDADHSVGSLTCYSPCPSTKCMT